MPASKFSSFIFEKDWKPWTTERSISDCHSHETVKLWGDGDFNVFILLLFLLNWLKLEVFFVFRLAFTFSAWRDCVQVGAYRGDLNIISLVDHLREDFLGGKKSFLSEIAWIGGGDFLAPFQAVHFWSIKGVYFFQNANNLNFKLFFRLYRIFSPKLTFKSWISTSEKSYLVTLFTFGFDDDLKSWRICFCTKKNWIAQGTYPVEHWMQKSGDLTNPN